MDYFRPDCESPARPDTFREHRAICNLTKHRGYVKSPGRLFFLAFHTPVEAVGNQASQPFLDDPEQQCSESTSGFVHGWKLSKCEEAS